MQSIVRDPPISDLRPVITRTRRDRRPHDTADWDSPNRTRALLSAAVLSASTGAVHVDTVRQATAGVRLTLSRTVSVCTTAESVRCGGVCHPVRRRGHTVQGGAGAVENSVSGVCRCRTYLDLSALATCCDEVPRRTIHEEIAADLDIAPATVGKQLRKIESRVLT